MNVVSNCILKIIWTGSGVNEKASIGKKFFQFYQVNIIDLLKLII